MFTDNTITVDYMTSDLLFGDYPKETVQLQHFTLLKHRSN